MSTLGLAFRTFFRLFGDAEFAERVKALFAEEAPAAEAGAIVEKRNAAVTLLATLQREARFLDFVMEPLDDYGDAQVGAAARDVHRDLGTVVKRVPAGFDPARYRLTGEVAGEPPFDGTLRHHGWQAKKCEMPAWTGSPESALVVSPSEVEV